MLKYPFEIGVSIFKGTFSTLPGIAKIDACVVFANKKAGAINSGILTQLNKTIMKIRNKKDKACF